MRKSFIYRLFSLFLALLIAGNSCPARADYAFFFKASSASQCSRFNAEALAPAPIGSHRILLSGHFGFSTLLNRFRPLESIRTYGLDHAILLGLRRLSPFTRRPKYNPAVSLDIILGEFRLHYPVADVTKIQQAYASIQSLYNYADGTTRTYRSGERVFDRATFMAWMMANNGRPADAIVASLYCGLSDHERRLIATSYDSDFAARVLVLLRGLDRLAAEPHFNPRIVEGQPDYSPHYWRIRGIQLSDIAVREQRTAHDASLESAVPSLRASLYLMHAADELQTLMAMPADRSPALLRRWAETKIVSAPTMEYLGLMMMTNLMRSQALRAENPSAFRWIRHAKWDMLKLSSEERLDFLKTEAQTIRQICDELGITDFEIQMRDKSDDSTLAKRVESRLEQLRRGQSPSADFKDQLDQLGLRLIVNADDPAHGDSGLPSIPLSEKIRKSRYVRRNGNVDERYLVFDVPHPFPQRKISSIPVELQIFTREAYDHYRYSSLTAKFRLAHFVLKMLRDAPHVAGRLLGRTTVDWEIRSDSPEPFLISTGHAGSDLDENIGRILHAHENENYPIFPVDADGQLVPLERITADTLWGIRKLPGNASAVDWQCSKSFGDTLERNFQAYSAKSQSLSNEPGSDQRRWTRGDPLALTAKIPPNAILIQDPPVNTHLRRWTPAAYQALQAAITTPRAGLLADGIATTLIVPAPRRHSGLVTKTNPAKNLNQLKQIGIRRIETEFGIIDEGFSKEVLEEVAIWQNLDSVSQLYQAVGSDRLSIGTLHDWYLRNYVGIDFREEPSQKKSEWAFSVYADEDQTGVMAEVTSIAYEAGWDITPEIELHQTNGGGDLLIHLAVKKDARRMASDPSLNPTEKDLKRRILSIRRRRGDHQSVENGQRRFIRMEVNDHSGVLRQLLAVLTAHNVVSIRAPERSPDSYIQTLEFIIDGPDTLDNPDLSMNTALEKTFEKFPDVLSIRVARVQDLIHLNFKVPRMKNGAIHIVELANESQVGVLKDIVETLDRMGWKILSAIQTPAAAPYVVKADIRLEVPGTPEEEWRPRLESGLATLRRFPGEGRESPGSRLGTIYFDSISQEPGSLRRLLDFLKNQRIDIKELVMEGPHWLEMDISATDGKLLGLRDQLLKLETITGKPLVTNPEVIWDFNSATAKAVRDYYFTNKMGEDPVRRDRFSSWMQDDPLMELSIPAGEVPDDDTLRMIQNANPITTKFHKGQLRKSDGAEYVVHPYEVAYVLAAYVGVTDLITILSGELHDAQEDLDKYILTKPKAIARYFRRHPLSPLTELEVAAKLLTAELHGTFPHFHRKLKAMIDAETRGQEQLYAHFMANLVGRRNTLRMKILLRALKLVDRVMNLKDRRPPEKQAENVAKTLEHFLSYLTWRPVAINKVYKASSRLFLSTLIKEVVSTSPTLWRTVVIPMLQQFDDYPNQVAHFKKWADDPDNSDCLPPVPPETWRLFMNRLESIPRLPKNAALPEKIEEIRTAHWPRWIWHPFEKLLVTEALSKPPEEASIPDDVLRRILTDGHGVARLTADGKIEIEEAALPALLTVINDYRSQRRRPAISLIQLRSYLYRHEEMHRDLRATPQAIDKLLLELKHPALYDKQSPFYSFEDLKIAFMSTYGNEFADDRVFVEELWVVFNLEADVLGDPVELISPNSLLDGHPSPLPARVLDLLIRKNLALAQTQDDMRKAYHQGVNRIHSLLNKPSEMAQWIKGLDTMAEQTSPDDSLLIDMLNRLRSKSLTDGIEAQLDKTVWTDRRYFDVRVREVSATVIFREINHEVYNIKIGPLQIIDQSLVSDEFASLIRKEPIVLVHGPIQHPLNLVPSLAYLLEMKDKLPGLTILEDGIGKGALGLTAMQLGAKRLVAIDPSTDILAAWSRLRNKRAPDGSWNNGSFITSMEDWHDGIPQEGDNFLFIQDSLEHWYSAPADVRQRLLGDGPVLRLSKMDPTRRSLFPKTLADILASAETVIVSGFLTGGVIDLFSPREPIADLADAGWRVEIKHFVARRWRGDDIKSHALYAVQKKTVPSKHRALAASA